MITVTQRQRRCLLHDGGEAVRRAGRPTGWTDVADRAVRRTGMNVSPHDRRRVRPRRRAAAISKSLALRLARASLDVLEALVELDEPDAMRG